MKKTKIVIAGGGFAGLYAAKYLDKHLARRPDIEVTLIARENFILFTPMLHEVAAGDLAPGDIVNPLRRILRHVNVIEADVQDVDLSARKVRCVHGLERGELEFEFDHLLLALGSETNFFDNAGIRDWAVTMKNLSDAALLRNRMVAFLEEATLENRCGGPPAMAHLRHRGRRICRRGNGRRGERFRARDSEVLSASGRRGDSRRGDSSGRLFVARVRRRARSLCRTENARAQSGSDQRRARGELRWMGRYAQQWPVDSRGDTHLDRRGETQPGGRGFAVSERERTDCCRSNISRFLDSPGCGRRAIVRRFRMAYETGIFFPPTAQHGMREAIVAAKNIERTILGQPLQPFRYRTMGMLASIGHHTGVASFFGFKFSGFIAWWMWRSVYLAKLPRLVKKLRVMIAWTLDLFFGRDIEQMITLRDVEELSERWARIRADRQQLSVA